MAAALLVAPPEAAFDRTTGGLPLRGGDAQDALRLTAPLPLHDTAPLSAVVAEGLVALATASLPRSTGARSAAAAP